MHGLAVQALKKEDDVVMDGAKAQALVSTLRAVRLAVVREQSANLLNKEVACCTLATD